VVAVAGATGDGVDLTIDNAACAPGFTGDDDFEACFGNPAVNNRFRVGRPNTEPFSEYVATDGRGFVSFDISISGQVRIIQEERTNAGGFAVACTTAGGVAVPLTTLTDDETGIATIAVADLTISGTEDIRCDWYTLLAGAVAPSPTAVSGVTPSPDDDDDDDGAGPVTGLPNTGAGGSGASSEHSMTSFGLSAALVLALVAAIGASRRRPATR